MEQLASLINHVFPDGIIYGLTVLVFLLGVFKCSRPVFRSAAALRRAKEALEDGAKARLTRPVWAEPSFLGKRLQPVWRLFLQNAELAASRGVSVDVADYVHEDSIITEPGRASLADIVPGLCTSLGILGTFVGLVMGLDKLDLMNMDSYVKLTAGISVAFYTSIVGLIASLCFNTINRFAIGRARQALSSFYAAFYAYGIPQAADATTQLLASGREQADAMSQFAEDMSVRMSGEIRHAITVAMAPVQRTMDDFINAATRAQVDGLDYIVARFIDRMNTALDGEMQRLGEAIRQTADTQIKSQADLTNTVSAIVQMTRNITEIQGVAEQVIERFTGFVGKMETAYGQVGQAQSDTAELLEEIYEASARQARYLSDLQEYQANLQGSFQDYTVWTDKFVAGLEEKTLQQNESLEQISLEMRASSELLRGAYKSFVESIELGLANALGLFDENMQNLTRQIHGTLSDIQETMVSLEGSMHRAANAVSGVREVS